MARDTAVSNAGGSGKDCRTNRIVRLGAVELTPATLPGQRASQLLLRGTGGGEPEVLRMMDEAEPCGVVPAEPGTAEHARAAYPELSHRPAVTWGHLRGSHGGCRHRPPSMRAEFTLRLRACG